MKFWDIAKSLSYNALWNFIVGARSKGKTYGVKKKAIERFLRTGEQFILVRRYREEFKDTASTFFDDLIKNNEFPDVEFKYEGKRFYINDKVAGFGFILSTSKTKKGMSFPNVWLIIFDEFILDSNDYMQRYLPNEITTLLTLYDTVARGRDVRLYALANALDFYNPYFIFFDIQMPHSKTGIKTFKDGDLLVEVVQVGQLEEERENSRFGNIVKGTEYSKMAFGNKFINNNDTFICKPFPKMRYYFTLKSNGECFGVYRVPDEGLLFVSNKHDKDFPFIYTTILDNHEPNVQLIKGSSRASLYKNFIKDYKNGCVRFNNQRTKKIVMGSIKLSV